MVYVGCQCGHFFKMTASQAGKAATCPRCSRSIRLVATQLAPNVSETAACLVCTDGPKDAGTQFFLAGDGPILVGKSRERDLCLADPMVSRLHCRLIRVENGWRIEDAKSMNGVVVNGTKVTAQDLRSGDRIELGGSTFLYATPLRPAQSENGVAVSGAPAGETPAISPGKTQALDVFEDSGLLPLSSDDTDAMFVPPDESLPRKPKNHGGGMPTSRGDEAGLKPLESPSAAPAERQYATGPVCPSCGRVLRLGAVLCTDCGINLKTGRAVLTSLDTGLDQVYAAAEEVTRWISWIIPVGLFPLASEALGTRKPYVVWAITIVTVLVSVWFLILMYTDPPGEFSAERLALWCGQVQHGQIDVSASSGEVRDILVQNGNAVWHYRPYQLLTHTLLHGGLMHLVGNMVFLLVFGSRVNSLVGQPLTAILYPALAALSGLSFMASFTNGPCTPLIGASGAIMGLAGMYFVFFPINKVHMVFWYRFGILMRFQLSLHIFAVRGFWVVLSYIGLDVLSTVLKSQDGVAHWAHLGGFGFGMALAVLLMMTRLVNARGCDLLSVIFGRFAWALIGSPARKQASSE